MRRKAAGGRGRVAARAGGTCAGITGSPGVGVRRWTAIACRGATSDAAGGTPTAYLYTITPLPPELVEHLLLIQRSCMPTGVHLLMA